MFLLLSCKCKVKWFLIFLNHASASVSLIITTEGVYKPKNIPNHLSLLILEEMHALVSLTTYPKIHFNVFLKLQLSNREVC